MLNELDFFDFSFLNEADGEEIDDTPDVGTNDSEPMEQDAAVGDNDDLGGGEDDDMGMDDGMGDNSEMGGDDTGMDAGAEGEVEPMDDYDRIETVKKVKLLDDYKELVEINEELVKACHLVSTANMTDKEKKLYFFCCEKLQENYDKLVLIINKQYEQLSYEKLLMLFYYCKIVCLNFSEMMNKFIVRNEKIELSKNPSLSNNLAVKADKHVRRSY